MKFVLRFLIGCLVLTSVSYGQELPWYVSSVTVTQPGSDGLGAVRLDGLWPDTCVPDAISHQVSGNHIQLSIAQPGLNVGCGDLPSPWSLTEEFTPNDDGNFSIFGSLFSIDPADRGIREQLSGPDLLYQKRRATGRFHGLGNQGEGYMSRAFDVSGNGRVVVGRVELASDVAGFITEEAFRWTERDGLTTLGLLPGGIPGASSANGVSWDGGTVVGRSTSDLPFTYSEAFRWNSNAGMTGLGNLIETSTTVANATSRGGRVIVGSNEFAGPGPLGLVRSAFRWTRSEGMTDLGSLVPGSAAVANDVSRDGNTIAGTSASPADPNNPFILPGRSHEPFVWTEANGMTGLGHLPYIPTDIPRAYFDTTGTAISGDGSAVVGTSRMVSLDGPFELRHRAFRWTEADGMLDLGELPFVNPLLVDYDAVDVSDQGRKVVGNATLGDAPHGVSIPFLWTEDAGMKLLDAVLIDEFGLLDDLAGWNLGSVAAISDDGLTIVGTGFNPDGEQEAWRVVLEGKVPSNGMFLGTGLNGSDPVALAALVPEPSGLFQMLVLCGLFVILNRQRRR